jgi:Tfp pilus assembly protein PilF
MAAKTRKEQLEELLAQEPDDPFLRYGLAMEYVSAGDDRGAVQKFEELIAVAADYVPAYLQLGQALTRLERPEEAKVAFRGGIGVARNKGDQHAAEEMQGFIDALS